MKMKKDLLLTVKKLREDGIDIKKTPPIFKWSYPEMPEILFQMLITEPDQIELPLETTIH